MKFSHVSFLPLVAAAPGRRFNNATASNEASNFDYIVVGGGTSGLVVANRLSADPSISVLIIEAGDSVFNNTNVTSPTGYGLAFGTAIDWAYQTEPQAYTGNSTMTIRAAKALGGTSTINGMAYTRAQVPQIDVWETLGNEGWNWDNLFPYYKKSEDFQVPDAARTAAGHLTYNLDVHGLAGPLKVGWTYDQTNGTLPVVLNETYQSLGLPYNQDVNSGDMVGHSLYPRHLDQELNVREDAARAYYYPYANRSNLKVLLNTAATKLQWVESTVNSTSSVQAEGVQVTYQDGTTGVINVNKEIILSAGALVSPLLLELSGVGNPAILSLHGIETVVDLPTVGENLQDQMNNGLKFNLSSSNATLSNPMNYVAYPTAEHLFGNSTASVAASVASALPAYASQVAAVNNNMTSVANLLEFFQLQHQLIFTDLVPAAEVLVYQSSGLWDSEYWALLPFSRGNVHIGSGSTTAGAKINPNYYMLDWDAQGQVQVARFIRKLYAQEPFAALSGEESAPGLATVPADADDETWAAWLKENYRSNFHPVGTASMLPKEKGGVVDAELKVYGTANVRVVDASVLPMQVCGHLVSTLYAVTERASDLILA